MATPNVSDIVATTIESRSAKLADNITKNNGLLTWIEAKGNTKTVSGGSVIFQELTFAENSNAGWYSGYDLLPVAASDVISAAQYNLKQAACAVVISGLEMLQNAGREQIIDLLDGRITVAEATMTNLIAAGIYSDGTGAGGKQIDGLDVAVPVNPATGVYGGIDRGTWQFWRSKTTSAGLDKDTLTPAMNTMWASLVRGQDRPELIVMDTAMWGLYMETLQAQQRFTDAGSAKRGFSTVKFMDADVILDGGMGGYATAKTAYFLNTKFLHWRPHAQRNLVPLSPQKRHAINQDAEVSLIAFAGNLTCSGAQFQGRLIDSN